eukprot:Gb_01617 [translate_table: standard]
MNKIVNEWLKGISTYLAMRSTARRFVRPVMDIISMEYSVLCLSKSLSGNSSKLHYNDRYFQVQGTLCFTATKSNTSEDRVPGQNLISPSELPEASSTDTNVLEASNLLRQCKTWDRHIEAELHQLGFPFTSDFIRQLLNILQEDPNMAFRLFVWTEKQHGVMHSSQLYLTMVEILIESGHFEEVLLKMLQEPEVFDTALVLLIKCHAFLKSQLKASDQFKRIKTMGLKPSQAAYDTLFAVLVQGNFLAEAKEFLTEMVDNGLNPDVFTLNLFLIALCNGLKGQEAAEILEKVEISGYVPSSACCVSLVRELCKAMNDDRAYSILSGILKRNSSTTRALNICLDAFCKAGKLEQAQMLIADSIGWGYVPNIVTFNSLIAGFCRSDRVEEAYLILERMREAGCVPDVISYNTLISGYNRKCMLSHSLNVFEEMLHNGISPDVWSYNSMIHGFFKSGKSEEANKLLQDMVARNFLPCAATYNTILNGLCKVGKAPDALKLFRKLKGLGFCPQIITYNTLIDGLCKSGRLVDARRILKEIGELGYVPNAVTYTTVMNCCFRSGKLEQGFKLFSEMKNKGYACDAFTYCTVISGLCKVGKFGEARACMEQMLSRGIVLDLVTYNTMINTFCKVGELDRAFQLLYEMETRGWISDVYTNTILIDGLCKTGDVDAAYRHFNIMGRKGSVPNLVTYNALIDGFCKAGKVDIAINLFKKMRRKDTITYTSMLHGLCKAGRVLSAYNLLLSCLKNRITVYGSAHRAVLVCLYNSGFKSEARKLKSVIEMTKVLQD